MKKIIISISAFFYCLCTCALTESEGISFIKTYYRHLSEYAAAENIRLAREIERMHVGGGYVYPDVEINLGHVTEVNGVAIKSVYLASIMSRQNLLLKFVPNNITLVSNSNGICTMEYILYVYSGNEQAGRDVLKYTVPLKIEIQNNDKKIRSILKRTKSSSPQYTLSVEPSLLTFDASGGARTITVNSNTNWSISVNTASWGHLTTNGSTLTLRVDPYTGTTDRTDYFKIKAGDKEERISIKQKAKAPSSNLKPSAQIKSISVSKDQDLDNGKGIIIHVAFDIQNMKNKDARVSAYFYDNNGNALTDTNDRYYTTDGKVAVVENIKPSYDNSKYSDLQLKIPYSELHQSGSNSRTLKFSVSIWDRSVSPSKEIAGSSSYTTFSYTPSTEVVLMVDNSASNKTKYFSESGGRETYYINTTASSYETWGVPSWCRIENKSSSSFTLVCEPNPTSSQRSDYMKVTAGEKEIRIDIKQEGGPSAEVNRVWVEHNIQRTGYNTYWGWQQVPYNYYVMRIHVDFDVDNMKGKTIRVCAFFYDEDGDEMTTSNNQYRAPDGQVTVQKTATPGYKNTNYSDVALEIPTFVMRKGSNKFHIQIQDSRGNTLATSSYEYFNVD